MDVRPEIAKTGCPLGYLLRCGLINRIVFGTLEARGKFFGQKCDLNMRFGCTAPKLMHYSGDMIALGPHPIQDITYGHWSVLPQNVVKQTLPFR